jgi:crotonobetainyl-CoA:carnitine CoA-transferase CaiB-like acyl-CoA transferase
MARPELMPRLRERLAHLSVAALSERFEQLGLPYAPIRRPEELYEDAHLCQTGGLADIILPDGERAGQTAGTALLPFTMQGQRLGVREQPPRVGEHSDPLLAELGYSVAEIASLRAAGAVA